MAATIAAADRLILMVEYMTLGQATPPPEELSSNAATCTNLPRGLK